MYMKLKCFICDYEVYGDPLTNTQCPRCRGILAVHYTNPVFKIDSRGKGVWRYSSLLPDVGERISLGEGLTPVNNVEEIYVKNERFNPTGSYADRSSAIITSVLKVRNIDTFTILYEEDFTKSLTHYTHFVGLKPSISIPRIDLVDLDDILFFISRGIDIVFDNKPLNTLVIKYLNPLTVEGLKTIAFEIYESRIPVERVVVPCETGLLALSILKGFKELKERNVDVDYEVVAVSIKNRGCRLLNNVREVKVIEVGDREVFEALREAYEKGFKTKPLSALSLYIAENIGKSLAVVTMGFKTVTSRESAVKKLILEILSQGKPMTAYEIWKTKPIYTLRAVYKAIKDMENKKEICFEIVSKSRRKIKVYRLC